MMDRNQWDNLLGAAIASGGGITVLTGAGISAESGIPTFRGAQGYWTVGSTVYHPQEMATSAMFSRDPKSVWRFYLYRYGVCRAAKPNAGHLALTALEALFPDRFTLITQNVDGLHLKAGQSPERTFQIHGNLSFARCLSNCRREVLPLPAGLIGMNKDAELNERAWRLLHCPHCGCLLRPHVLWFDEYYDEVNYKADSALGVAAHTALLIVVGTAGATQLPNQIVARVVKRGAVLIDINTNENPFGLLAHAYERGGAINASAAVVLPELVQRLKALS